MKSVNKLTRNVVAWNWGAKAGLFYAGTNLLCNIWCWFRLPETKDRTFGEIDLMFDNHVPARKFKYTTVDQFAITSGERSEKDEKALEESVSEKQEQYAHAQQID